MASKDKKPEEKPEEKPEDEQKEEKPEEDEKPVKTFGEIRTIFPAGKFRHIRLSAMTIRGYLIMMQPPNSVASILPTG